MSHRLGDPQPFVPELAPLGEVSQLGMAPGEEYTGLHGRQEDLTAALAAPRPVNGRYGLPQAVDRPADSRPGCGRLCPGEVRQGLQDNIPAGLASARARWAGGHGTDHTRP